ncbi:MAG TPA: GAF domain-containing protein [Salinivirgaceae bacterium]|nr:GAF domain-containing protein [Salinivirgaceae bacterium]HQA75758.1 GAF domain-containing protein [Salinivirgaceae bacterium]
MEKIKKHKRQLSYLFLLSIIVILCNIVIIDYFKIYDKFATASLVLLIVIIAVMHLKVRRMFSAIKAEYIKYTNSHLPENITIKQVINPKEDEDEEQTEHKQNNFNSLIEQFDKINDPIEIAKTFLSRMAKEFDIVQGLFYKYNNNTELFEPIADYAFYGEEQPAPFGFNEGLNGQVARDCKTLYLKELPDNYRQIMSGLGKSEPKYIIIMPIVSNDKTVAVVELALFNHLNSKQITILEKILNNLCGHFEK